MLRQATTVIMLVAVTVALAVGGAPADQALGNLSAVVETFARVALGGPIVMTDVGTDAEGETTLSVGANYGYKLATHWLTGAAWDSYQTWFTLVDITVPAGPGMQTGKLRVHIRRDTLETPTTGDATGAAAYDNASVIYQASTVGTVQVTLSAQ